MKQPELTEEENEIYLNIVRIGTMDDMFNLGYAIGRERLAKEQIETLNKSDSD